MAGTNVILGIAGSALMVLAELFGYDEEDELNRRKLRQDELKRREASNREAKQRELSLESLSLQKKGLLLNQAIANEEIVERSKQRRERQNRDTVNRGLTVVNQNAALRNNVLNMWSQTGFLPGSQGGLNG